MSRSKKKELSKFIGLYFAGVAAFGVTFGAVDVVMPMSVAQAADGYGTGSFNDRVSQYMEAHKAEAIKVVLNTNADGSVTATLTGNGTESGTITTSSNSADSKTVDLSKIGLEQVTGSVSIDTGDVVVKADGEVDASKASSLEITSSTGNGKVEVAGDTKITGSNLTVNTAIDVASGTLNLDTTGTVAVKEITVASGAVVDAGSAAVKATTVTTNGGTITAGTLTADTVAISGGSTVTAAVKTNALTVSGTGSTVSGTVTTDKVTVADGASASGLTVATTGNLVLTGVTTAEAEAIVKNATLVTEDGTPTSGTVTATVQSSTGSVADAVITAEADKSGNTTKVEVSKSFADRLNAVLQQHAGEDVTVVLSQENGQTTAKLSNASGSLGDITTTAGGTSINLDNLTTAAGNKSLNSLTVDTGNLSEVTVSGTLGNDVPLTVKGSDTATKVNLNNVTANKITVEGTGLTVNSDTGVKVDTLEVKGTVATSGTGTVTATKLTVDDGAKLSMATGSKVTADTVTLNSNDVTGAIQTSKLTLGSKVTDTTGLTVTPAAGSSAIVITTDDAGLAKEILANAAKETGTTIDGTITKTDGSTTHVKADSAGNIVETKGTTAQQIGDVLRAHKGEDVVMTLAADADGKTTIKFSANGTVLGDAITTDTASTTINLTDLALGTDVPKSLTIDTGNLDAVTVSGTTGISDLVVTSSGTNKTALTLAAGTSVQNVTVKGAGISVTADGAAMKTLTVAEGATLTTNGGTATVDSFVVEKGATVAATGTGTAITAATASIDSDKVTAAITTSKLTLGENVTDASGLKVTPADGKTISITANSQTAADAATALLKQMSADGLVTEQATITYGNTTTTYKLDGTGSDPEKIGEATKTNQEIYDAFIAANKDALDNPFQNKLPTKDELDTFAASLTDTTTVRAVDMTKAEAVSQAQNQILAAYQKVATPQFASRQMNSFVDTLAADTVSNRMSAVRNNEAGSTIKLADSENAWLSIRHGKADLKGYGTPDMKYNNYQLGYDCPISDTSFFGLYVGTTTGSVSAAYGTQDIDNAVNGGIYVTRKLNKASYLNYLASFSNLDSEYKGYGNNASWQDRAYSLSVEYGKKIDSSDRLSLTPYTKLSYNHADGTMATIGGNTINAAGNGYYAAKLGLRLENKTSADNMVYGGLAYTYGFGDGDFDITGGGFKIPSYDNNMRLLQFNLGFKQKAGSNSFYALDFEKTAVSYNGWNVQGSFNLTF